MSAADLLGFVIKDPVQSVKLTVHQACAVEEDIWMGDINENDAYGWRVPYPECARCSEVICPDVENN